MSTHKRTAAPAEATETTEATGAAATAPAIDAAAPVAAPVAEQLPQAGGSYTRLPDGTLVPNEPPKE